MQYLDVSFARSITSVQILNETLNLLLSPTSQSRSCPEPMQFYRDPCDDAPARQGVASSSNKLKFARPRPYPNRNRTQEWTVNCCWKMEKGFGIQSVVKQPKSDTCDYLKLFVIQPQGPIVTSLLVN